MDNSQAVQGLCQGRKLRAFDDAVNHVFGHPFGRGLHALGSIPHLVGVIVGVQGYSSENCRVSCKPPEHGAHHRLNLARNLRPCY